MSLPVLAHTADIRSITERVNVLIRDLNTGRADDLTQALADIAALQGDVTTLQSDVSALEALHSADATVFLGSNVSLNNTGSFFNGPNTGSIGASGQKWLIIGIASVTDTGGAANIEVALYDGSSYIASIVVAPQALNAQMSAAVVAVATLSGATTFTLRAKDQTRTTGVLQTTGPATGVSNRATSISAVRLA